MSSKLMIAPALEPVSVAELDEFLRGDGTLGVSDNATLASLITAAREFVEEYTHRALISQTWVYSLDQFSVKPEALGWWDGVREGSIVSGFQPYIELPKAPLISVASLTTFSTSNIGSIFNSANYFLDRNSTPGRLILNSGIGWPVGLRSINAIEVLYNVGYGPLATDVPSPLRLLMKQIAAHWYENREDPMESLPSHSMSLLNRYRVMKL